MPKLPPEVTRDVYLNNRLKHPTDPDEILEMLKEHRDEGEPLSHWLLGGIIELLESRSEIRKAFAAIQERRKKDLELYARDEQIVQAVKEAIETGYGICRADKTKVDSKIGAFDIVAKKFTVGSSSVEKIYYAFYPSEKGKNK